MPVGFQNAATVPDQRFQAAASNPLRSPPKIGRRRILPWTGSGTAMSGVASRAANALVGVAIESRDLRYDDLQPGVDRLGLADGLATIIPRTRGADGIGCADVRWWPWRVGRVGRSCEFSRMR